MIIKSFEIIAVYDANVVRRVSGAKDSDQAWEKFKRLYFGLAPAPFVKPRREDYYIKQVEERVV